MIAIVDYGLGNIRSVKGALEKIGREAIVTSDAQTLDRADKIVMPGVGGFGDGMANLRERGLDKTLTRIVMENKKPILGICLGFQLFAKSGTEFGESDGLGWIDAEVVSLAESGCGLRLPHVGWNDCDFDADSPLFSGIDNDSLFYYVHSFHMKNNNPGDVTATCTYDIKFSAAIHKNNIYGTQFHPEKSQLGGLALLKNFVDIKN